MKELVMTRFMFEAVRSNAPADQVPGRKCSMFNLSGEMDANSIYSVKESAVSLMLIPGVYSLRVKNADPECEWKDFGPIDTRKA